MPGLLVMIRQRRTPDAPCPLTLLTMATGPDDPDVTDDSLREEIWLLAELMIAAADRDQPLSEAEVDEALGLRSSDRHDCAPPKP